MVVNRDYAKKSEATLKFASRGIFLEELDRRTGQWSKGVRPGRDSTLQVKLDPGDGRLFRMTRPPRDEAAERRGAQLLLQR